MSFEDLQTYLGRRAVEARPELADIDSDAESEPDMSWTQSNSNLGVELIPPSHISEPFPPQNSILKPDLHDVPSPPGSASPLGPTPIPPTPPFPGVTAIPSLIKELPEAEINSSTLPAYTPVQQEDANIFMPQYFDFVNQRIEQDRERQRRKEDNSGFMKSFGNVDEEIAQITNTGKEYIGDVFAAMATEQEARKIATKYD
jgi:hypothetical protein